MLRGSRGRYPFNEGSHLIMAVELWAYGDESGIQPDAPACVIAGYVGSPRHWTSLKRSWAGILQAEGVSDFHAHKFFSREEGTGQRLGDYRGWSDDRALAFIENLAWAIHYTSIRPLIGAVNVSDFMTFPKGARKFLTGGSFKSTAGKPGKFISSGSPAQPYYLAFMRFIDHALKQSEPHTRVNFIFDQQNVLEGWAQELFRQILADLRERQEEGRVGLVAFGSRQQYTELQVADLNAHLIYSLCSRPDRMGDERKMALSILRKKQSWFYVQNRRGIEANLQQLPDDALKEMESS